MAGLNILSVTQITSYLKSYISEDPKLSGLYIKGEISDFKGNYYSGHLYFSLKDADSKINCVMFGSYAARLRFEPREGMSVIVRCDVSFYQKSGACQLYVYDIQPEGLGAKYLAFEQLKEKLEKEGLFSDEHKKAIPAYPERIGVITSAQGAAIHDIINVLGRRWPLAKIILSPVNVQGENAHIQLTEAVINQDSKVKPDVIIIGRGGGSSDDLSEFNDEGLVRAIYACETPIISAVGHETDFSICDFVADMRAPTPSAAAELVSPDINELRQLIDNNIDWLENTEQRKIDGYSAVIKDFLSVKVKYFTANIVDKNLAYVKNSSETLVKNIKAVINEKSLMLEKELLRLDANNPAKKIRNKVITVEKDGREITSVKDFETGDEVSLFFADGKATAKIVNKSEGEMLS